jgi:hypothetical protein
MSAASMSSRTGPMDEATLKIGLLMEGVQANQQLAESHLEKLRAHTAGLDAVVRDEIRRTLLEELQMLTAETEGAADRLRRLAHVSAGRAALWSITAAILGTGIPIAVTRWTLPSGPEIAALSARRDGLAANIAALERQGGRIEWGHCGETARLCVRVDRKAPTYGAKADYYTVAGN